MCFVQISVCGVSREAVRGLLRHLIVLQYTYNRYTVERPEDGYVPAWWLNGWERDGVTLEVIC